MIQNPTLSYKKTKAALQHKPTVSHCLGFIQNPQHYPSSPSLQFLSRCGVKYEKNDHYDRVGSSHLHFLSQFPSKLQSLPEGSSLFDAGLSNHALFGLTAQTLKENKKTKERNRSSPNENVGLDFALGPLDLQFHLLKRQESSKPNQGSLFFFFFFGPNSI